MADRGRDLRIGLVSDLSQFTLDQPAKELERVGDAADTMGRDADDARDELRRLATQGQDAQRELDRLGDAARGTDLDRLGDDAKQTARKVDDAFDAIATSSRQNFDKTGASARRGMREAEAATDTFRQEAKQNVSEVVSSFDGSMDSIADVVQGTLGGVVADLGAVGLAAASAGAVAVGYVFTQMQQARERIDELRSALTDLFIEPGDDTLADRIRTIVDQLKDTDQLQRLAQDARTWNVSFADYVATIAEGGDAAQQMQDKLVAMGRAARGSNAEAEAAAIRLANGVWDTQAALDGATVAADAYAIATGRATEESKLAADTVSAYDDAIKAVGPGNDDLAQAVETAAKRRADATKDESDTWQDYADDVTASIDDVIKAQERDLDAKRKFQANSEKVFSAVGQAGIDWALSQGENADKAMQLLANAPRDKQDEIVRNFAQAAQLSGDTFVTALSDAKEPAQRQAEAIATTVKSVFGAPITIRTRLETPSASAIWQARREIEQQLGTLDVPVGVVREEARSRTRY